MPPPTDFTFDIPIFAKLYDFYKNLSLYLLLFPKPQRYTVGQKLDSLTLEIFELVIRAGYLPKNLKSPFIERAITLLALLQKF